MVAHTARERPDLELEFFVERGSIVVNNRNRLAELAREWGADWLLWLDADHYFPEDTLLRLLAHGRDIVGCNYPRRSDPTGPTAQGKDKQPLWTTPEKAEGGELEEVRSLGLGVCLVSAAAIEAVPDPKFDMVRGHDGRLIGEDNYFFSLVRHAGFKVWCDHALSWEVGHVNEGVLWNLNASLDRARWKMKHGR